MPVVLWLMVGALAMLAFGILIGRFLSLSGVREEDGDSAVHGYQPTGPVLDPVHIFEPGQQASGVDYTHAYGREASE